MCKLSKIREKLSKHIKLYIGSPDNKSKEVKMETVFGIIEILSYIENV